MGATGYSIQPIGGRVQAGVHWITVSPHERRKWHARRALEAISTEARSRGADRLGPSGAPAPTCAPATSAR
jgi:GNAT superfamily N-acetyltransferase